MKLLDLTLNTPAENLALDEALLEEAEQAGSPREVLRLWESPQPIVVVGRSSKVDVEVHRDQCRQQNIPILRRSSGGASIVAGPGCLIFSVLLSYQQRPALRMIDQAHCHVLGMTCRALAKLTPGVEHRGTSDLVLSGRKCSGNSLRCKRKHLLYHGTLLYQFPLELISSCLARPPREPEYRKGRSHADFMTNLPADAKQLRHALIDTWQATEPLRPWPRELTQRLVDEKYSRAEWNFQR